MSFIKEKTKSKPLSKKKILIKLGVSALSALIFATVAAGAFVFLEPRFSDLLGEEQQQTIIIEAENSNEEQQTTQIITSSTVDMQKWQYNLYAKGNDMYSALVRVGTNDIRCGAIISMEGGQITVMAEGFSEEGIETPIRFFDGTTGVAKISGIDSVTGLAILSVDKASVPLTTQQKLGIVDFGNSKTMNRGQYVIAIGSPSGKNGSVVTGVITGVGETVSYVDREYSLLSTDIGVNSTASGFLIAENGNVVGIITHDKDIVGEWNSLTAIGITEITDVIENLANGKALPYIGIEATTVTEEMKSQYQLPEGIYVDKVVLDSPALAANIQVGDVIVGVGKKEITSVKQLQEILMNSEIGETIKVTVSRQINGEYGSVICEVVIGVLE